MRWIKLLITLLSARFSNKISLNGISEIDFRVWITDIDASIMNHAEIMTVFETGRIDFMIRTGFLRLARENKWYFPSRSITVQFIRPLRIFQKARLSTKILHMDDRWVYTEQKITRNNKIISICVNKSTIKKGKEIISPLKIADELGCRVFRQGDKSIAQSMSKNDDLIYTGLAAEEKETDKGEHPDY